MTFRPYKEHHAIGEVVFGLQMARPFSPQEIAEFSKNHQIFKDKLPRSTPLQFMQFSFGSTQIPGQALSPDVQFGATANQSQNSGAIFERFNPDGTLSWRLMAEGSNILVNCLDYEGWESVWPEACFFLNEASRILVGQDNAIKGLFLQYVDFFDWIGPDEKYDLRELLSDAGKFVSQAIFDKGPYWHLHQGWFQSADVISPGRQLERVHIDGVVEATGAPRVRFDTYLGLELHGAIDYDVAFGNDGGQVQLIFDGLHRKNKKIVCEFLTADMCRRIGIDA